MKEILAKYLLPKALKSCQSPINHQTWSHWHWIWIIGRSIPFAIVDFIVRRRRGSFIFSGHCREQFLQILVSNSCCSSSSYMNKVSWVKCGSKTEKNMFSFVWVACFERVQLHILPYLIELGSLEVQCDLRLVLCKRSNNVNYDFI